MKYVLAREKGRAASIFDAETGVWFPLNVGNHHYRNFLAWNAKQETPLDLSDKPPEPPPVDADLERVKEIIAKADGDITAGELKELVLKFVRKRI